MAEQTALETMADGRRYRVCGWRPLTVDLDLGTAGACSQSPSAVGPFVQRIPYRLACCNHCDVIQLVDTPEWEWLRPRREFSLFRGPERHRDDLCMAMMSHFSDRDTLIPGPMYQDVPALERFHAAGISRPALLERTVNWELQSRRDGIETTLQRVTPAWAQSIRNRLELADVLSVRHCWNFYNLSPIYCKAAARCWGSFKLRDSVCGLD